MGCPPEAPYWWGPLTGVWPEGLSPSFSSFPCLLPLTFRRWAAAPHPRVRALKWVTHGLSLLQSWTRWTSPPLNCVRYLVPLMQKWLSHFTVLQSQQISNLTLLPPFWLCPMHSVCHHGARSPLHFSSFLLPPLGISELQPRSGLIVPQICFWFLLFISESATWFSLISLIY